MVNCPKKNSGELKELSLTLHYTIVVFPLNVYAIGFPPIGLKQERERWHDTGDTKSSSGPTTCEVQLHQ